MRTKEQLKIRANEIRIEAAKHWNCEVKEICFMSCLAEAQKEDKTGITFKCNPVKSKVEKSEEEKEVVVSSDLAASGLVVNEVVETEIVEDDNVSLEVITVEPVVKNEVVMVVRNGEISFDWKQEPQGFTLPWEVTVQENLQKVSELNKLNRYGRLYNNVEHTFKDTTLTCSGASACFTMAQNYTRLG